VFEPAGVATLQGIGTLQLAEVRGRV
jgi:hypothetical protein